MFFQSVFTARAEFDFSSEKFICLKGVSSYATVSNSIAIARNTNPVIIEGFAKIGITRRTVK